LLLLNTRRNVTSLTHPPRPKKVRTRTFLNNKQNSGGSHSNIVRGIIVGTHNNMVWKMNYKPLLECNKVPLKLIPITHSFAFSICFCNFMMMIVSIPPSTVKRMPSFSPQGEQWPVRPDVAFLFPQYHVCRPPPSHACSTIHAYTVYKRTSVHTIRA